MNLIISRLLRRDAGTEPVTDLGRYKQHLRELATVRCPDDRAEHLESMAFWADMLSLAAEVAEDPDDGESVKWAEVALLCRAVAATERGFVLIDACETEDWIDGYRETWIALARAARFGLNPELERAEILHGLYEAIAPVMSPGAALVLDDIAATEMAIAAMRQEPEVAL